MRIIFFNHYHNGDIHYSREFIKDIIRKTSADEYCYYHINKSNLLKDIDVAYGDPQNIDRQKQIIEVSDNIFINTWIGQCGAKYITKDCSIYSNYNMYKDIFNFLNIEIEELEYYLPSINYDKLDTINIEDFLSKNKNKKILICNGSVLSGQCPNFSFDQIIFDLSLDFPNIDFILTNKINISNFNIFFTDNIINIPLSDLNEISYLSTKCDIIVGRASGPHAFTHIKENYNNINKTYISFADKILEGNWYSSDKCKQIWSNNYDESLIKETIKKELEKL